MQQSEILSLVERLIPVYGAPDFNIVLEQLTHGEPASAKVIAKMELNRLMAPCTKSIDLRGRVQGECRKYKLDGRTHWLDDVAINSYHKKIKRFGSYTEGVYEAMVNTRNNFRVMHQNTKLNSGTDLTSPESPFEVEPIKLGLVLNRQEKRLKMSSQVDIKLKNGQEIHATSVDLSNSGVKLKVPSAFDYNLGESVGMHFVQLEKQSKLSELNKYLDYRIIGIEECYENDSIRWLRALRLTDSNIIGRAIDVMLNSHVKKANHDNQDKVLQARTHGYEHTYIKYTRNLPLFFSGTELKYALLNDFNKEIWDYWHDERYQQTLSSLFNTSRMDELTKFGAKHSSNVVYTFVHEHQGKALHYSLMLPEANRSERQLFWHTGARRSSWKVFRIHMYELSQEEKSGLTNEHSQVSDDITHFGLLQEISNFDSVRDYQLTEKPSLNSTILNKFRHSRKISSNPTGMYFDATSRRKEQRYQFRSPIDLTVDGHLSIAGETVNFSSCGLYVSLSQPLLCKVGDTLKVSLKELQQYDLSAPLTQIPYSVVCVSPEGSKIHLVLEDNSTSAKAISFLKKLITHNKNKLQITDENLPSIELLHAMYDAILPRLVSTPFYISKLDNVLQPIAIGLNYPLAPHLKILQKLGHKKDFSLEPIFKNRSARLLKEPTRPVPGAMPIYHDIYIAVIKNADDVVAIYTKLYEEFPTLQERLRFVKKSKQLGEFYALRINGVPVASASTKILIKKLGELASSTFHHARALEKEFSSIVGFGEIIDITEEVLIRLELT